MMVGTPREPIASCSQNIAADVLAIARELTDAGADWQLHAYGHAMHAFTHAGANMPERGLMYDAPAERRSWIAMRSFLEEVFEG